MAKNKSDTKPQPKRITFISRTAPYGQNRANLCLDMALAAAVFEQDVSYVFLGEGVYQLLKGQDGAAIDSKTLGNALETLALYGIENVYVDIRCMEERSLSKDDLLPGLQFVDGDTLSRLLEESDTVFNL